MKLKEFLKEYVCPNTMIRLWKNINGHERLCLFDECEPVMDWELMQDNRYEKFYMFRNSNIDTGHRGIDKQYYPVFTTKEGCLQWLRG